MIITTQNQDNNTPYKLLDSGNGMRLEQFGSTIIIRPDAHCIWKKKQALKLWQQADLICTKNNRGPGFSWQTTSFEQNEWIISYTFFPEQPTHFVLRTNNSKNIGLFPEQEAHWRWMIQQIQPYSESPSILNLFAYTGAASIIAAQAGAKVTHVDSAKSTIAWAKKNAAINNIDSIRWIHDDCMTFVQREIKRGNKYNGIILDPPAFGHDHKGAAVNGEEALLPLLQACKNILVQQSSFLIINVYGLHYSAEQLHALVRRCFPKRSIEYGELHVAEMHGTQTIPCNIFVRLS